MVRNLECVTNSHPCLISLLYFTFQYLCDPLPENGLEFLHYVLHRIALLDIGPLPLNLGTYHDHGGGPLTGSLRLGSTYSFSDFLSYWKSSSLFFNPTYILLMESCLVFGGGRVNVIRVIRVSAFLFLFHFPYIFLLLSIYWRWSCRYDFRIYRDF